MSTILRAQSAHANFRAHAVGENVATRARNGAADVQELESAVFAAEQTLDRARRRDVALAHEGGVNAERRNHDTLRGDEPPPEDSGAGRFAVTDDARGF